MLMLTSAMLIVQMTVDARSTVADLPIPGILTEVRELWKPYLTVAFRSEADPEAGCAPTVRLIITDRTEATPDAQGRTPLGWIEFVDRGQPAQTITVSARTARMMQQDGRWLGRPLGSVPFAAGQSFLSRALGRAIAHEIGHYVLRSTAHSSAGLMRPRFSVADIMDRRSHFRLGPEDEARLAARLATPEWQIPGPSQATRLSTRVDSHAFPTGQLCPTRS
jgi:hypothetical protein